MRWIEVRGERRSWQHSRTIRRRVLAHARLPSTSGVVVHGVPDWLSTRVANGFLVFHVPGGIAPSAPIEVRVAISGFRDTVLTLPPTPADAEPWDLGELDLSAEPTLVSGRVVDVDGAPLASATLAVADASPSSTLHVVPLRTPVATHHRVGAEVTARTSVVVASSHPLVRPAPGGARYLEVSSRAGISVGDLLAYGASSERAYVRVASLPASAELVELETPLVRDARGVVDRVTLTGATSTSRLAKEAHAGDGVLWLEDAMSGVLRVGGSLVEAGLLNVGGTFALRGVSRPIALTGALAGYTQEQPVVIRDLSRPDVRVAVRLQPPA